MVCKCSKPAPRNTALILDLVRLAQYLESDPAGRRDGRLETVLNVLERLAELDTAATIGCELSALPKTREAC